MHSFSDDGSMQHERNACNQIPVRPFSFITNRCSVEILWRYTVLPLPLQLILSSLLSTQNFKYCLGGQPSCATILNHTKVSRMHCKLDRSAFEIISAFEEDSPRQNRRVSTNRRSCAIMRKISAHSRQNPKRKGQLVVKSLSEKM